MELVVLGSSSKGNGYILDNGNEALILEAGISVKAVKEALGFNLRKVAGCVVTHRHNDHAGDIKHYVGLFPVLALQDVLNAKHVNDRRAHAIELGQCYRLGNFTVKPYEVWHDVPCVGYLIHHPSMGLMLFATDTYSLDYTVPGLNHILIECNYSVAALTKAIEEERTDRSQVYRLSKSHLEFASTKAFLRRNDLSHVTEVVLIHLSENNADENLFVSEIQAMTGKPTYAAHAGLRLDFGNVM